MVTSLDSSIRQTKAKLKLVEHKYSQPQQIIMTTMKRLSEEDVRKIFNCVTNNKQPPERLKFKIIRVPQNGMKLSPPSFEFDDGLYVLLRSQNNRLASVPSNLSGSLLTDNDLMSLPSCPWSLSGPQNPKRKKAQQRYCYPKGNNTLYNNDKGGAMWTMLDSKGKEDPSPSCRVLHVYYSKKRSGRSSSPVEPQTVATRKSKRKSSGDDQGGSKKNKVVAATNMDPCPSLLEGAMLKSPCQSQMSFEEFDDNLTFTSSNIFDIKGTASFLPAAQSNVGGDMFLNNPAFNSAAARPNAAASSGYYYGQYSRYPPVHSGGGYYGGDWARTAPSIPQLTSSEQNKSAMSVNDFSRRLREVETSITADIHASTSFEQEFKLHLLQNWAKGIAKKPLKPQKAQEPQQHAEKAKEDNTPTKADITSNAEANTTKPMAPKLLELEQAAAALSPPFERNVSKEEERTESSGTPSITPCPSGGSPGRAAV